MAVVAAAVLLVVVVVVAVVGVCSPLVFGVWPAFIHWRGGGWRLFAFGLLWLVGGGVCSPLV